MPVHTNHPRHIHKKKPAEKIKPSPLLDKVIFFAAFFGPIITLPQIYTIWVHKETDVSVVSWVGYTLVGLIWIAYAIKHNEKAILASNLAWLLVQIPIIVGVLTLG